MKVYPIICILIVDVESQKLQQSLSSPTTTTLPPAPATAPPFIEYALTEYMHLLLVLS